MNSLRRAFLSRFSAILLTLMCRSCQSSFLFSIKGLQSPFFIYWTFFYPFLILFKMNSLWITDLSFFAFKKLNFSPECMCFWEVSAFTEGKGGLLKRGSCMSERAGEWLIMGINALSATFTLPWDLISCWVLVLKRPRCVLLACLRYPYMLSPRGPLSPVSRLFRES